MDRIEIDPHTGAPIRKTVADVQSLNDREFQSQNTIQPNASNVNPSPDTKQPNQPNNSTTGINPERPNDSNPDLNKPSNQPFTNNPESQNPDAAERNRTSDFNKAQTNMGSTDPAMLNDNARALNENSPEGLHPDARERVNPSPLTPPNTPSSPALADNRPNREVRLVQNPDRNPVLLQKIEVILKDKGMDSRSTIQALQLIYELLYPLVPEDSVNNPSNVNDVNNPNNQNNQNR